MHTICPSHLSSLLLLLLVECSPQLLQKYIPSWVLKMWPWITTTMAFGQTTSRPPPLSRPSTNRCPWTRIATVTSSSPPSRHSISPFTAPSGTPKRISSSMPLNRCSTFLLCWSLCYFIFCYLFYFSWDKSSGINHTFAAIKAGQYTADFFVNEARRSLHKFSSWDEEDAALIYNFLPTKTSDSYVESYFFVN